LVRIRRCLSMRGNSRRERGKYKTFHDDFPSLLRYKGFLY
jgi:hypothetical protein